jgi:parallel beta-helix repeat protein
MFVAGTGQALSNHVGCGAVLTQDTKLDNDLVDCPGNGLVIGADGISVNLNGHLVDSDGQNPSILKSGIDNSGGFDFVDVKDGRVSDFFADVNLANANYNVVSGIDVSGHLGIYLDDAANNLLKNNVGSNSAGIYLYGDSDNNRVVKNTISQAAVAIFLGVKYTGANPSPAPSGNRVVQNQLLENDVGMNVIAALDNEIKQNTLVDNASYGIYQQSGTNPIEQNSISGGGSGIFINVARQLIARNHVHGTSGDGIHINVGDVDVGPATVVERNLVERNGDDGIDIDHSGVTVTRNRANDNGDLGIEAAPGVTDGGGNRASGNGNPAQCTNVFCS